MIGVEVGGVSFDLCTALLLGYGKGGYFSMLKSMMMLSVQRIEDGRSTLSSNATEAKKVSFRQKSGPGGNWTEIAKDLITNDAIKHVMILIYLLTNTLDNIVISNFTITLRIFKILCFRPGDVVMRDS